MTKHGEGNVQRRVRRERGKKGGKESGKEGEGEVGENETQTDSRSPRFCHAEVAHLFPGLSAGSCALFI